MAIQFISASVTPAVVDAGQGFILAVELEYYGILYDSDKNMMYDSNGMLISPAEEYTSAYTGDVINKFVGDYK